uniref:Translocation protein SEC63 n=1 Tax=Tetraselmis sp. GSL018 TaxID=582737 RepID=A0A061SJW4_9CHLO
MDEGTKHQGSSPLFAIFCLSLLVLFLVPYSIYQLCCGAENEKTHKAWAKSGKTKSSLSKALRGSCTRGKIIMLLLWGAVAGLLFYIQTSQKEIAPFDPFAIMELSPDATEKEVKKQYYKLAKERHPDKNPDDPQAAEKFDLLAKAYNALTDETARENYKKYGHPDGPQAMNIGVAMPSFLFNPDKQTAPIMLLALVGIGILLPLAVAACYLTRSNKYAGPNQVQHETLGLWLTHHKFGIKESQGLRRILDTLVVAKEFIDMPVPSTQAMALEELKKLVMRFNPELKGLKQDFWKRKASIVKAHMLLIVFMERAEDEIPEILKPDLKMILQRSPSLLAELMNVAVYPRKPYFLYAWMCPAVAVVEMMQCLTQAVPVRVRKPTPTSSGKSDKTGEAAAGIMQLPWMDAEIAKKLAKRKVKSLGELSAMPVDERGEALLASGYSKEHIEDVETFLSAMPTVHAEAGFHVEGHASIMEGDMVTADVRVALTRPSHKATKSKVDGALPPGAGGESIAPSPFWLTPQGGNGARVPTGTKLGPRGTPGTDGRGRCCGACVLLVPPFPRDELLGRRDEFGAWTTASSRHLISPGSHFHAGCVCRVVTVLTLPITSGPPERRGGLRAALPATPRREVVLPALRRQPQPPDGQRL